MLRVGFLIGFLGCFATANLDANFGNDDFNIYVVDTLRNFLQPEDQPSLPVGNFRAKRDENSANQQEKCKMRKKKFCCADEAMEKLHDKEREIKKECFKEIYGSAEREPFHMDPFKCEKVEKHKRDAVCIFECVGKKNNLLDEQGNIKSKEFTDLVTESFSNEKWFSPIKDKVISSCLEELKNTTIPQSSNAEEKMCNPSGIKMVHCLFREVQLGCPDSEIKDMKVCSRIRERIKNRVGAENFPPPAINDT